MNKHNLPKILMVDDLDTNLLVLEYNLTQLNVNIFKANSGQEALQYFYNHEFAVVLLDIQMLDLDGFQTAELMRKYEEEKQSENHIQRQTPIIFITAVYNNDPYIQRAYALGGVDYLVKPINPLILKYKVAVFIELYQNYYQIQQQAKQLKIANEQLALDINKRQKIELALRQSEEKFRSAFDYAAIGMALVGLDGKWLQVNRSLCEILGYSEEELLQKNIQSITHPDDIEIDLISMQQLLQGEINSYQIEKRYLHKKNRIVWILLNSSLVADEPAKNIYFIMQIQDISERKIAEESMLKLANIVASSDDAIISTDLSGIITSWNQGAEKIYGYSESEIKGKSFTILLPESHNTEGEKIIALIKQGKAIDNYETLRQRKDEKIIDVSLTISPIKDTKGQIIGLAKIARDITERKRIEEALRRLLHENSLILNSAGEGICGIDEQGKFRFVNPAASKMLGYEIMELISQPINLILTNSSSLNTAWESSILYQSSNDLFMRKDQSTFPVEYIMAPLSDQNKMLGAVLTFKDISDRLIIEQMKDEFISIVSHELRTPLTSIRGALGLLAGGLLKTHPEKAQRMLDIAVINTDRLVRLINDILDIERI
ncbi:MAG TPA: PAS domain S-box protein, partial [Allocoleopsis sp.]